MIYRMRLLHILSQAKYFIASVTLAGAIVGISVGIVASLIRPEVANALYIIGQWVLGIFFLMAFFWIAGGDGLIFTALRFILLMLTLVFIAFSIFLIQKLFDFSDARIIYISLEATASAAAGALIAFISLFLFTRSPAWKKVVAHDWDGCRCRKCSAVRDEEHIWDGCRCRKCPGVRNQEHSWDGCRCQKCSATRDQEHNWDGCACKKCFHTRHNWQEGRCTLCNEVESSSDDNSGGYNDGNSDWYKRPGS